MLGTMQELVASSIVQQCLDIKERLAQKQHFDAKYLQHFFSEFEQELDLYRQKNDDKTLLANVYRIVEVLLLIKSKILTDSDLLRHTFYPLILSDALSIILKEWQMTKQQFTYASVFESIIQFLTKLITQDSGDKHISNVKFETIGLFLFHEQSFVIDNIALCVSCIVEFDVNDPNIARLSVLLDLLARYHKVKLTSDISIGNTRSSSEWNRQKRYDHVEEKKRSSSKEGNVLKVVLAHIFSEAYVNSFSQLPSDASLNRSDKKNQNSSPMVTRNEFFLITCPKFIISWPESISELLTARQQSLNSFTELLKTHLSSLSKWSDAQILSIGYLLKMIVRFVLVDHLQWSTQIIDQSLQILNEIRFHEAIKTSAHNSETILIDSAVMLVFRWSNGESSRMEYIKKVNKFTETLIALSNARSSHIQLYCYLILVYTITEEELRALKASGRIVDAFAQFFRNNLHQSQQTWRAIPLNVVLNSLKIFIQYDQIKNEIIHRNHLSWFVKYLSKAKLNAQIEQLLLEIIWSMTFNQRAAIALKEDIDFMDRIKTRARDITNQKKSTSSHGPNARLRAIEGILWKLEKEGELLQQYQMDDECLSSKKDHRRMKRKVKYDAVISYAVQDKDICQRLQAFLKHRHYRIWMETTDSTSMNQIVPIIRNAACMFVCMSNAYKQTTHCQAQAMFATNRSDCTIVPVIVQINYHPDGWLAKLVENVECLDLTDDNFEQFAERLKAEISGLYKEPTNTAQTTITTPVIRRHHQYWPPAPDSTDAQESFDDSIEELLQWTQTSNKIAYIVQTLESVTLTNLPHSPSPFSTDLRDMIVELIDLWNSKGLLNSDHQAWLHHCSNLFWLITCQIPVPSGMFNGKLMNALQTWIEDVSRRWDRFLNDENTQDMSKLITISAHCRSETLLASIRRCIHSTYYQKAFQTLRLNDAMRPGEEFILLVCPQYLINSDSNQQQALSIPSTSVDKILTKFTSGYCDDFAVLSLTYFITILAMNAIKLDRSAIDYLLTLLSINNSGKNQSQHSVFLINSILELLQVNQFDGTTNRTTLALSQIRAIFEPFRYTSEPNVQLYASAIVAHTMDEQTIREYQDLKNLMRLLMENLQQTIGGQDASMPIGADFLLDSLKALVQHDQVKIELFESKQLSVLISYVTKAELSPTLVHKAIEILWSVSFYLDAASALKEDANLINVLKTYCENKDGGMLATASEDLLWQLQIDTEKPAPTNESVDHSLPVRASSRFKFDIMLSYAYADRELVNKLDERLTADGYSVWIDKRQMADEALDTLMARGVQSSEIFLFVLSNAYQKSNACHNQAGYAGKCGRLMLSIRVANDFKPFDWLSVLMAKLNLIDFTETTFELAYKKLIDEIERLRSVRTAKEG